MVLQDDKLNILKDPKNNLGIILNQCELDSEEVLDVYKKIISDDNLAEAVKLAQGGFKRLKYTYYNVSDLINKIDNYKDLIDQKPLNFSIMPDNIYNRAILEDLGKD